MSEPDPGEKRMTKVDRERAEQLEQYRAETVSAVVDAVSAALIDERGIALDENAASVVAEATLRATAGRWRVQANLLADQKSRGWQTVTAHLREAAGRLVGDAQQLVQRRPAAPDVRALDPASIAPAAVEQGATVLDYLQGKTNTMPDMSPPPVADMADIAGEPGPTAGDDEGIPMLDERGLQQRPVETTVTPEGYIERRPIAVAEPGAGPGPSDDVNERAAASANPWAVTGLVEPSRAAQPTKRERWTWEDFDRHIAERGPMQHRSHSQLDTYADCGVKYGLRDLERPAWWSVGGSAFHAFVEAGERLALAGGPASERVWHMGDKLIEERWRYSFDMSIRQARDASGVDPSDFAAAKRGTENGDWWLAAGLDMCKRYTAIKLGAIADQTETSLVLNSPLIAVGQEQARWLYALEHELDTKIDDVPWKFIPDQVRNVSGRPVVIDLKSGSSTPTVVQLARTAHALVAAGAIPDHVVIGGAYYSARSGRLTTFDDVRALYSRATFEREVRTMNRSENAQIYLPRRSTFCGSCTVSDLCPALGEG